MFDLDVGNYRGSLHAKDDNGQYFWAVECDMDHHEDWGWEEIPFYLYLALVKHSRNEVQDK